MANGRLAHIRVGALGTGEVGLVLTPTVDIGGIRGSRELEAICIVGVKIGGTRGTWDHGFKLLAG